LLELEDWDIVLSEGGKDIEMGPFEDGFCGGGVKG
jgi:hypothetical protein